MSRSETQVVIAWQTTISNQGPNGSGIVARQFGLDGKALGAVFLINETTLGNQTDPSIASMADGSFTVAWRSAQNGDGMQGDGPNRATSTFSPNKTNAAKRTTVVLSASGSYLLRVKITAQDGSFMTSDITVKV